MIAIIPAEEKDYTIIHSLAEIIWPHTYSNILSGEQLDFMFDMMYSNASFIEQIQRKNHRFLLAKQGEKYIGYASYEVNQQPGITKIHKLYVLPQLQRAGAGRAFVKEIESIARQNGNTTITLNVNRYNPAAHFYLKNGFSNIGKEDIEIGNGYLMEDYIMQKKL